MAWKPGLDTRGRAEVVKLQQLDIMNLRKKGFTYAQIGEQLGMPLSTVCYYYREAMKEAVRERDEMMPYMLEITVQGFDQLEEIILANGRINLEAQLKLAILNLAAARSNPDPAAVIQGRTLSQWEIEVERLEKLSQMTLGMVNEDVDRLHRIRDRRAQYLGVEPAKKLDVEHTFVVKATEAQQRLRARLGLQNPVPEAEVVTESEAGEEPEDAS